MSTIRSDPSYGLNLDPATTEALIHFARRRRVLLVLRAIAAGIVTLIAMMLLVALCDYLWFLSDSVRWMMSVVGYALVFAVMWWQGLGRVSESDPKRLARQLETAEPRLREYLLSAVELADPQLVNGSEGFRQRLQRRVAHRLAGIDIGRVLPVGLVQRPVLIGALALLICIVLLLIPQMQFGRRIARAMLPGVAIQRASLTEVTIVTPSPATGYVAEGDAVAVVVRLSGAEADQVTLRWRSEEGAEGETEMTPRVGPALAAADGTLDHDNLFAANLSIGSVPVEYQVLAGDAITLWNTLTPLPRPRVASFSKRYVFPHYTKLGDRIEEAEHGDLKALIGTTAEVTVNFDQPVEGAVVRFANHEVEVPLESVDGSDQRFVTSITIKTPGQYQVDATAVRSGLNNPFSPQYAIDPVIDSPPVVRWSPDHVNSTLVSPLDVVHLKASASDDLPLDMVVQEFIVNSNPMLQREIPVAQSMRDIELAWDWDLMRRNRQDEETEKLTAGDIVRTRTVAIDRRGNRGESRWIEFLVTDEGFDADRHQPLDRLSAMTVEVSQWALQLKELSKELAEIAKQNQTPDFDSTQQQTEELHQKRMALLTEIGSLLEASQTLPEAGSLELIGRAIIDLDQALSDVVARWSDVRRHDHPSWKKNRDKVLREIASESRRLEHESARLDGLARSAFGLELTIGVVGDGLALLRSLQPLLKEEPPIPLSRFPRHLTVAIGRLEAIAQLMKDHEDALPDSTVRHFGSWYRWSDSWLNRLKSSVENPMTGDQHRQLIEQFHTDLTNQVSHAMVDGQINSALNNMFREVQAQIGPAADLIRRLPTFGEAAKVAKERVSSEENADVAAGLHRDIKLATADWDRTLATLRGRLAEEEALHRRRSIVDLQFAADMKLLDRAIENVTQNGYQPYREEIPAQVHQKLANAFQMIEAKHHADQWLAEIGSLLDAERRLESEAVAKIGHPSWLERFSVGLEWPVRYFKNLSLPWEEIEPIESSRYSNDYNQARQRIVNRRWSDEELLTADTPLTSLENKLSVALAALEPRVVEARQTIQSYVLTLPEQARQAAEKAEQAEERTENRNDSQQQTAEDLAEQQQDAEQAAMETVESLVDLANTSDITDQQERELARDADAAAAQIQDAVEQAQEKMEQAAAAPDDQQRSDVLDDAAQAMEDLADTLRQTADHFERAENGEDVSSSREQLRAAEDALEIADDLQQRYEDAEEMAAEAQSDPQDLMRQLEQELQTNQPMRQELSEIAQRATEAAQRTLEQAARDETSLNQSLESSDPTFQEQKRRIARQLQNLSQRAATVDRSLLNAAERAVGWANEPEARPKLNEARQQLQQAVQEANQLGGENAVLSSMQQAAQEMTDAVGAAVDALQEVQQRTQQAADKDIHQDKSARDRARQQVEQFERTARNQRVQAAGNEKRNWSALERDASNRMRQADRQKRDAENAKRRLEDQLKRDQNKNNESLKAQVQQQQQRAEQANRAADAAEETRDFAKQKIKETDQRTRDLQKQKIPPLNQPNPAAEAASRVSQQAVDELESIGQELADLSEQAGFEEELRTSQPHAQQFAQQQQRIGQEVADAAEQLQRAARHEQRLGQDELAQQLDQAAEMIAQSAMQATDQAEQSLQAAAEDVNQTPTANRDVGEATEQIADAAQQLAQMLSSSMPQSGEPSDSGTPTESEAEGQQLARTLDELDRALAQSQQQPSSSQQAQNSQGENQQGSPQEGQPQGQPSQNAAEASPTLANAMNQQAQQSARQRQQQMMPASQGNQPGQDNQQASTSTTPAETSGIGEMPDGGMVDTEGIVRIGSDWGNLRERRTEDAAEAKSATATPQYRREIEAYFRAVAKRAAERSK